MTTFLLAGLWVWSRRATTGKSTAAATHRPPRAALSIPALAALFALQWAAFTYLLLSGCAWP